MKWRGEEVPRRPGPSLACLPRSLGLFPPSIVPNLLSFRLSSLLSAAFTSLRPKMGGWMEARSDRPPNCGGMDLLPALRNMEGHPPLSMPMNTVEFSCRGGICMYVWMYHYYHKYSLTILPRLPLLPPISILAIHNYVGRWLSSPGWRMIRQTDREGPFLSFPRRYPPGKIRIHTL